MALFFDELVPYGDWVDYKQYGPVWYPTKEVGEGWRPYLDGRWVPSAKGWVFETRGTLGVGHLPFRQLDGHPGIWLGLGPGQHLVRLYRYLAQAQTGHRLGPGATPNYEPEPAFVPAGGFPADTPAQEQLIPAMYVFAEGPAFCREWTSPIPRSILIRTAAGWCPRNSFRSCFPQTELINNFVSTALNPEAVANWGPPLDQVSECTGVTPMALVNTTYATDVSDGPELLAATHGPLPQSLFVSLLPTPLTW